MHRSNLDHMSRLLALKNTVAATAGHASDIEKLGPVDKVIVLASCDTNAICLHLEAQATFVLPQCRRHSRLHTWRSYLARSIVRLLRVLLISARRRLHIGCHGWQRKWRLRNHLLAHGGCRRMRVGCRHWWHCVPVRVLRVRLRRIWVRRRL